MNSGRGGAPVQRMLQQKLHSEIGSGDRIHSFGQARLESDSVGIQDNWTAYEGAKQMHCMFRTSELPNRK